MPYEIGWLKEGRIFKTRYYGIVTMEELEAGNSGGIAMVRAGTPPVHAIVDTTGMTKFPTDFRSIKNSTNILKEPNFGWLVLVGASNPLILFLTQTLSHLAKARFKEVRSHDEALATLERVDVTLGGLRTGNAIPQ